MSVPVRRGLLVGLLAGAAVGLWGWYQLHQEIDRVAGRMEAIAAEAAAGIDGEAHARVVGAADAAGADFTTIRAHLRRVTDRHKLRSPLYTLRAAGSGTAFVVMTNPSAFIGDTYVMRPEMRAVFERGERNRTGLYSTETGAYVSGLAPVRRSNRVVALVSADRPAHDLVLLRQRGWMLAGLAALLFGLLGGWLPEVLRERDGRAGALRRIFAGSLTMRIGIAGTASVVLAVGIVAVLDHREAKRDLVDRLSRQLSTAVRVGAPRIDPDTHQRVAASGDGKSDDFIRLRDVLREIKDGAGLSTPVYTFRRDGELARFVVMTNETPFVGDPNELRPALRHTFDTGEPGTEDPYSNATGTWLSAFAPIRGGGGAVVGVLQADYEVGTLLTALTNHALRTLLFALVGIGVAFLLAFGLARGIARPIRAVADAAARIRTGDFDVQVPEERIDEVGELSAAINRMARGLNEREQLRTMFGRYMAGQVVSELLKSGELSLEGELRDVTVVISDIRGYTALTESLGARDVVALLNDYFAILVEEVVRHEGVIDKFMGDAMLCWFGAPVPQPDLPTARDGRLHRHHGAPARVEPRAPRAGAQPGRDRRRGGVWRGGRGQHRLLAAARVHGHRRRGEPGEPAVQPRRGGRARRHRGRPTGGPGRAVRAHRPDRGEGRQGPGAGPQDHVRVELGAMRTTLSIALFSLGCGATPPPDAQDVPAVKEESRPVPPTAKQVPKDLVHHGHTRNDPYYWLRDDKREDPDVLAYLNAENAYAKAVLAPTEALQKALFEEMKGRIKKDDSSVPVLRRGYWYYSRFSGDGEYPVHCRRKGSMEAPEQVLLDVNVLARGHDYFAVAGRAVSENEQLLAYAEDTVSRRLYTIRVKDLRTGKVLPDAIPNTSGSLAWAADDKTLFYVRRDPTTLRPHAVYRHVLGTDVKDDVLVFDEKDEAFYVGVGRTKSRRFVEIESYSTLVTEILMLEAKTPEGAFQPVVPRAAEHEYSVWHQGDLFYIRTNFEARNFRLVTAPVATSADRSTWKEIIPGRGDVFLSDVELFDDYMVVGERKEGLRQLRVIDRREGGAEHYVQFDEAAYVAWLGDNPQFDTHKLRFEFSSPVTPDSVFEYDLDSRERRLLKQDEVLGGFDPKAYRTERFFVDARDGAKVPVTVVMPADFAKDGSRPLYQYAYGAYGYSIDPEFSATRLSLLDRGFAVAECNVRGGQEMGRDWYDQGRTTHKTNTFNDFIDCSEALIERGFTKPERLIAGGGSAGGLLMGAVANMRPDLYRVVYAAVPFVDVLTTMLDDTIPLTTGEYDEWGNPNEKAAYDYILTYSPYDNVKAQAYPNLIVTTGLHDSQVQYFEPAKWVAKLRATKTDDHELLLDTDMETGHGGASGRFKKYERTAKVYAYFLYVLDPTLAKWKTP